MSPKMSSKELTNSVDSLEVRIQDKLAIQTGTNKRYQDKIDWGYEKSMKKMQKFEDKVERKMQWLNAFDEDHPYLDMLAKE